MGRAKTSRRRNEPLIDALPEYFNYRDDGCDVSPSCLRCPLPQCKYDDPASFYRQRREQRDLQVLQMSRFQGESVLQLAHRFGVSTRTIQRILSGTTPFQHHDADTRRKQSGATV